MTEKRKRPYPVPRKGTKCRRCPRPATRYGWEFELDLRGKKKSLSGKWIRLALCDLHVVEDEFGFVGYACPSRRCERRRHKFSGGFLHEREDFWIYVPLKGTIDDMHDENDKPIMTGPLVNPNVKCPWCGRQMGEVR